MMEDQIDADINLSNILCKPRAEQARKEIMEMLNIWKI